MDLQWQLESLKKGNFNIKQYVSKPKDLIDRANGDHLVIENKYCMFYVI